VRVVVGSDGNGLQLKTYLANAVKAAGYTVIDIGVNADREADYPHVAFEAGQQIAAGTADRAVLVCGTGLGMAIAANKIKGVRAVTAHDIHSVERSVLSNNAQVLCMGQQIIGPQLAERLVQVWLTLHFDSATASARKVGHIVAFESAGHLST
jgi:ribose 5-phosphate isomerase B